MAFDRQFWPIRQTNGTIAKGKYGKFEYRFSLNKPFATNIAPVDVTNPAARVAVDNNGNPEFSKAGYVEYQFLDSESNLLPFKVGSYLGTKRVFNLGAGFYHQKDGTRTSVNSQIEKHDIALYAIDAFADLPLGNAKNKMALSAYTGFYNYNFGPNYLRNLGIMNLAPMTPISSETKRLPAPETFNQWWEQETSIICRPDYSCQAMPINQKSEFSPLQLTRIRISKLWRILHPNLILERIGLLTVITPNWRRSTPHGQLTQALRQNQNQKANSSFSSRFIYKNH